MGGWDMTTRTKHRRRNPEKALHVTTYDRLEEYEVNLLYIAGLVSLILGGAGTLSVDRHLSRNEALSERPKEHQQAI